MYAVTAYICKTNNANNKNMKTEVATAAKAIKADLKKAFPAVKFSVTSESYAGGNSVNIYYVDGPLYSKVDELVRKYQFGSFDGSEDRYNIDNAIEGLPQAKFVHVSRKSSESVREEILNEIRATYEGCENVKFDDFAPVQNEWVSTLIHRVFSQREY